MLCMVGRWKGWCEWTGLRLVWERGVCVLRASRRSQRVAWSDRCGSSFLRCGGSADVDLRRARGAHAVTLVCCSLCRARGAQHSVEARRTLLGGNSAACRA